MKQDRAKVISISIPEVMHADVKRRRTAGRYSSVSEYLRDLVRKDLQIEANPEPQEVAE